MNTSKRSSTSQELWIGGGIKLPTGKYHLDPNDPEANLGDVNSQMGTGSVDFLLNTTYNLHLNKFGINATLNYKINTSNNDHYEFGNRFTSYSFGYYEFNVHSVSILPNAGIMYEDAGANHMDNEKVDLTGGYVALAVTGAELSYKMINIGANVQLPFVQDFAEGKLWLKRGSWCMLRFHFSNGQEMQK